MTDYGLAYGATADGLWVRVGDQALDLAAAEERGLVNAGGALRQSRLDVHLAQGPAAWRAVRRQLSELLTDPSEVRPLLRPVDDLVLQLPFTVADYVDFYSSENHASNVGRLFRPGQPPLPPNWKHLPIGYHGRAGTVVVSGSDITRPCGQRKEADGPVYGPSTRLDIEAEVGFVVGVPSQLAERVPVDAFADYVFGVVLLNDWSARDIQAWEYQPLGPFLGKSFATSISAWVTPLEALTNAWVPAPPQDPPVVSYLADPDRRGLDLRLEVDLNGEVVSRPPFRTMYWTPAQQLAHLTVNGARLRTGDLFASGTVSGPTRGETGSLLELNWGEAFLADGDTVTIRATAPGPGGTEIALGEVTGTIRPAEE